MSFWIESRFSGTGSLIWLDWPDSKAQITLFPVIRRALVYGIDVAISSVQFSHSVVSDSLRPRESQHSSLPVHHQLPEFTQTHAHRVGGAIQPSHPLSSPSPPAPNPSQHQGLFQWVNSSHQVAKVLEIQLQHQSFQWTPRTDLLQDGLVGSPCSPRDSQESSPTPQFKSISSLALSFLHSPTLAIEIPKIPPLDTLNQVCIKGKVMGDCLFWRLLSKEHQKQSDFSWQGQQCTLTVPPWEYIDSPSLHHNLVGRDLGQLCLPSHYSVTLRLLCWLVSVCP